MRAAKVGRAVIQSAENRNVLFSVIAMVIIGGLAVLPFATSAAGHESGAKAAGATPAPVIQVEPKNDANDEYYFQAVAIVVTVASLFVALLAIGAGLLGMRIVRNHIDQTLQAQLDSVFDSRALPIITAHLESADQELAQKFQLVVEQLEAKKNG